MNSPPRVHSSQLSKTLSHQHLEVWVRLSTGRHELAIVNRDGQQNGKTDKRTRNNLTNPPANKQTNQEKQKQWFWNSTKLKKKH